MKYLAGEGAEVLLIGLAEAGQRDTEQGPAVEATAERDDGGAIGIAAGDLDRILDGLSARRQEDGLVRSTLADQPVQPLCECDMRLVCRDLECCVRNPIELFHHRSNYPRMIVADIQNADPADEIKITPAVGVPKIRAFGPIDDDRMGRQETAGNALVASVQQFLGTARRSNDKIP